MEESYDIFFKNVSFAYGKENTLEDVTLTIEHGDFASIVGPNGSGKTTFLKLLLGLIKPDTGKIEVFGDDPEDSRLRIGYMPQHAHLDSQFPVTVMDVVLMGRLGHSFGGKYTKKDRKAAEDALEEMQMSHLAKRNFNELSGGQRQGTLIARALCCEPEMLLLDEPTANIDPEVEEALFEILHKLNKRMTILLVSHDLGFVSQKVKTVICINRCVVVHPTSEINGEIIKNIYGGDICMIRHDHRCSDGGQDCD